jgi:hypothetical protein
VSVFGLPPLAHEDDPVRALLSCLKMQQKLSQELGIESSIGVTSGMAYCGIIGSSGTRREYTVLGDTVNLSARLMQAAERRVLCDAATFKSARGSRLRFTELPAIRVKGKSEPIVIYEPSYVPVAAEVFVPAPCKFTVGRLAELNLMNKAAENMAETGHGSTVMLLGEEGMGKTHLLRYCSFDFWNRYKMRPVWGKADMFNPDKFFVWRQIMRPIIALCVRASHSDSSPQRDVLWTVPKGRHSRIPSLDSDEAIHQAVAASLGLGEKKLAAAAAQSSKSDAEPPSSGEAALLGATESAGSPPATASLNVDVSAVYAVCGDAAVQRLMRSAPRDAGPDAQGP